jgi:endonuclease-3
VAAQFVNQATKCSQGKRNLDNRKISTVLRKIKQAGSDWETPAVVHIGQGQDPFRVLVSCILSLRTRDEVTAEAFQRLLALADHPQKLLSLDLDAIEKAIYPVAFYRNKTKALIEICRELVDQNSGKVPDTLEELLQLKGVGRKTANLTLILGYRKMGICVDTHVHRICNRLGYVKTSSPDATEKILRDQLPTKHWMQLNELLVAFGQNICKPISPLCSQCCVHSHCEKIGVGDKHR